MDDFLPASEVPTPVNNQAFENYKGKLEHICNGLGTDPTYSTTNSGSDGNAVWTSTVYVDVPRGLFTGIGHGSSQHDSVQQAAKDVLTQFQNISAES